MGGIKGASRSFLAPPSAARWPGRLARSARSLRVTACDLSTCPLVQAGPVYRVPAVKSAGQVTWTSWPAESDGCGGRGRNCPTVQLSARGVSIGGAAGQFGLDSSRPERGYRQWLLARASPPGRAAGTGGYSGARTAGQGGGGCLKRFLVAGPNRHPPAPLDAGPTGPVGPPVNGGQYMSHMSQPGQIPGLACGKVWDNRWDM